MGHCRSHHYIEPRAQIVIRVLLVLSRQDPAFHRAFFLPLVLVEQILFLQNSLDLPSLIAVRLRISLLP